jgi:hypothetical protein
VREISPVHPISSVNEFHTGRDQDYLNLNLTFTVDVVKNAIILRMFPKLLRPYVTTSCQESVSLNQGQDRCTRDI